MGGPSGEHKLKLTGGRLVVRRLVLAAAAAHKPDATKRQKHLYRARLAALTVMLDRLEHLERRVVTEQDRADYEEMLNGARRGTRR